LKPSTKYDINSSNIDIKEYQRLTMPFADSLLDIFEGAVKTGVAVVVVA
jgi:hypothetical protein